MALTCKRVGIQLLKCIFSPIILLYLSIKIYLLPCIGLALGRCFSCFVSCACCAYIDTKFPRNQRSIGEDVGEVEWKRMSDCGRNSKEMVLFEKGIEPDDIEQGSVGNCWLMSAFACLAEYPGAVQRLFNEQESSTRGKYSVQIYDGGAGKWQTVTVDDFVPCKKGTCNPVFASAVGNEMWVMIYEKAFAKYCGSYAKLSGGFTIWGLNAMTGDPGFKLSKTDQGWKRFDIVYNPTVNNVRSVNMRSTDEAYDNERVFNIIWEYSEKKACLAASSNSGKDTTDDSKQGVVQGHAYTILRVIKEDGFKLLKLRNPWGSFEWSGDWSDNSPMWSKHPNVAKEADFAKADDGCFWMEFSDFCKHYRALDVLDRSTGVDDLVLVVNETDKTCGLCKGCCFGCLKFWCCCKGWWALMCGHKGTGITREGHRCCCCWL